MADLDTVLIELRNGFQALNERIDALGPPAVPGPGPTGALSASVASVLTTRPDDISHAAQEAAKATLDANPLDVHAHAYAAALGVSQGFGRKKVADVKAAWDWHASPAFPQYPNPDGVMYYVLAGSTKYPWLGGFDSQIDPAYGNKSAYAQILTTIEGSSAVPSGGIGQ